MNLNNNKLIKLNIISNKLINTDSNLYLSRNLNFIKIIKIIKIDLIKLTVNPAIKSFTK